MKVHASRQMILVLSALALLPVHGHAMPGSARQSVDERLGIVSFPTSCLPAERKAFDRGVALLHDFWYQEARPQFELILKADPQCAMAHWGLAMSRFHQLWDQPSQAVMDAGWKDVQAAQAGKANTARERAYIAALAEFYKPAAGGYPTHVQAYAVAMGELHARFPTDVDAATFYALALLAEESPDDTSLSLEHRAMAILQPLFVEFPSHPGVVHYIIHACDSPSMANDGLAAARRYGVIAASGPHAVHMPGHIFARLGLWKEDIDANLASVAASRHAEDQHESGWMDQFHSDDFLVYAYLQSGQEERAREIAADAAAALRLHETMPDMMRDELMAGMFPYYRLKLPIFIALETRNWASALAMTPDPAAPPETQTQLYWAQAIAAGHKQDEPAARAAMTSYEALLDTLRHGDRAYMAQGTGTQVRLNEVHAWHSFAAHDIASAERQMRAAADLQDKVGQGEVDIPAREMLADMLSNADRPKDALAEYRAALLLSPGRFNGLYGAGRAAEASGDNISALKFYRELLQSTDSGGHTSRPELAQVKERVNLLP